MSEANFISMSPRLRRMLSSPQDDGKHRTLKYILLGESIKKGVLENQGIILGTRPSSQFRMPGE